MEEYLKTDLKALIKQKKIIYIEPKKEHEFTFIWLHGYGDTHFGFYEIFMENINPFGENTKIVLPCAPLIKTKASPAFRMNSWFDIDNLQLREVRGNPNERGISQAVEFISQIIEFEVQFLSNQYDRIFLGGFSQGFMLTMKVGLESERKLGGVLGFCGLNFGIADRHSDRLPVFAGISKNDSVIPYSMAMDSFQTLKDARKDYNFYLFTEQKSGHTITFQGYKKLEEYFASLKSRYISQA